MADSPVLVINVDQWQLWEKDHGTSGFDRREVDRPYISAGISGRGEGICVAMGGQP